MAAQQPAPASPASPELRKAPLSPRYLRNYTTSGGTTHRIQKLADLAFLAPDVVRDVFVGSQPTGLTTEWLLRHAIPVLWNEQREMLRAL